MLAASAALQLPSPAFAAGRQGRCGLRQGSRSAEDLSAANTLWPLTFDKSQRATATVLCDLIIPADDRSPAASKVGVVDFIDEWISAPYPNSQKDRPVIIDGLAWIDAESQRRFSKDFVAISAAQRAEICDQISAAKPDAKLAQAAEFFSRFRSLTAGGYYTTPVGMKELNYVGNVALTSYEGPPAELLKKLGLA